MFGVSFVPVSFVPVSFVPVSFEGILANLSEVDSEFGIY
jgi:hypothetical protein